MNDIHEMLEEISRDMDRTNVELSGNYKSFKANVKGDLDCIFFSLARMVAAIIHDAPEHQRAFKSFMTMFELELRANEEKKKRSKR